MKYFLSVLLLVSGISCGWAADSLHHARARWKVVSYSGPMGAATFNANVCGDLEAVTPETKYSDIVTARGHESELRWSFVKQIDRADVYHFTFTRKIPGGETKTETKDVNFANRRLVVFQDDLHCVVMEPPSAEDLKSAPVRQPKISQ